MMTRIRFALASVLLLANWASPPIPAQEKGPSNLGTTGSEAHLFASNKAVIVVTGMRLDETPETYSKDLSVAEGALVTVTSRGGATREKRTTSFMRSGRKGSGGEQRAERFFTADFEVDLEAIHTITMTFRDGTVVRVEDYVLPMSWKTHFYFHSTTGTKSPASILRFVEDPRTKLRCCVYAVYPVESYHQLGGRQL